MSFMIRFFFVHIIVGIGKTRVLTETLPCTVLTVNTAERILQNLNNAFTKVKTLKEKLDIQAKEISMHKFSSTTRGVKLFQATVFFYTKYNDNIGQLYREYASLINLTTKQL